MASLSKPCSATEGNVFSRVWSVPNLGGGGVFLINDALGNHLMRAPTSQEEVPTPHRHPPPRGGKGTWVVVGMPPGGRLSCFIACSVEDIKIDHHLIQTSTN